MATKSRVKEPTQNGSTWEQATFVQRELIESEQAACKKWDYSQEDAFSDMSSLSQDGYKVTFRFDDFNSCHACWYLPPKDSSPNSGLILTGRGSTPFKAFKQAMYKHQVLFQGEWPRDSDRRGGQEIDD